MKKISLLLWLSAFFPWVFRQKGDKVDYTSSKSKNLLNRDQILDPVRINIKQKKKKKREESVFWLKSLS